MKKFITNVLLFLSSLLLFNYTFVWLYEIPKRQAIKKGYYKEKINWNNIIKKKQVYDLIIIGSSRAYCSYNPIVIDSCLNIKSYNMGSGSQYIVESYYILKEIFKYQKPKTIVYEIFLPSFEKPNYYHVLGNAEYMSEKGKWDMILNGFKVEGLYNAVFTINGYRPYIKNDLSNIINHKKSIFENSHFIKGYKYSNKIIDSIAINAFPPIYSFKNMNISMKNLKYYLIQMDKLCEANNAKLICVRAPYPPTRLNISKSDTVNEFFKKFLKNNNIPFFDFNYINNYIYKDFDFEDRHHMNSYGANKVSKELVEILKVVNKK